MKTKRIWLTDEDGLLIGDVTLNEMDDYREGAWIIPAFGVEKEPLNDKDGYLLHWNGQKWDYAKIEFVEDEEEEENTTPEMLLLRLNQEFCNEKNELNAAFVSAQMKNDTKLQLELREELAALEKDYEAKKEMIENGQNLWEVENA